MDQHKKLDMNNNIYIYVNEFNENVLFTDILRTACNNKEITIDNNNNVVWHPENMYHAQMVFIEENRKDEANVVIDFWKNNDSYSIHKYNDLVCANYENIQTDELLLTSKIMLESENELLKNEKLLDRLADTYLGKLWTKKTKDAHEKYSSCIKQLKKKYMQIMETIGFLSLKESMLIHITENYFEYILCNNLNCIGKDNYDDLINFCKAIDSEYGYTIYENENVKSRIFLHLDSLCESVQGLTQVEHFIKDMSHGKYRELCDIYPEYYSMKLSDLRNKFARFVEQMPIGNIKDVFDKYEYMKEYDASYNIKNLIAQNINVLCDINANDVQKLSDYIDDDDYLHKLIEKKIKNICEGNNYSMECKLCYLYNLRNIVNSNVFVIGNEFRMYLIVEKYIRYLTAKIFDEEYEKNTNQISNVLEKKLYCETASRELDMSIVTKKLLDLEEKYIMIAKKYEESNKRTVDFDSDIDSVDNIDDRDDNDKTKGKQVKFIIKNTQKTNKTKQSKTK